MPLKTHTNNEPVFADEDFVRFRISGYGGGLTPETAYRKTLTGAQKAWKRMLEPRWDTGHKRGEIVGITGSGEERTIDIYSANADMSRREASPDAK